ncbi:MAG: TonB-dependent receptor [Azospira sp.]|jgi:iron complex outermembrane receptor protein|nr:TonB-dependent receptor [Azospira sp.]
MNVSLRSARRPLALLVAAALPGLAVADADVVTLDTVVVSGSRVEHSSFDLPAAIDVVDAERIGAGRARVHASEALAAVPGITVLNRQNYAQDLQISSRGFGARSAFGVRGIRLVADGIPASMPDGQGQAATFNLDRAERIEVMRGPLSAVYGNHAGGVIQLFTPDGKGPPSVETNVSGGSYGSWKADVAAQGEVGGIAYVLDASRFSTDGYRDHSAATRDQQMVKIAFSPTANSRLTMVANGFRQMNADDPLGLNWAQYRAAPRSVDPVALTFDTRKRIDHTQGGISYEHRFGDDVLQASSYIGRRSVIQYQSIPVAVQRIVPGAPANAPQRRHSGGIIDFDRDFSGVGLRWIMHRKLAGGKLTTTFGIDHETSTDERRGWENFILGSGAPVCGVAGTVCGVKGNLRRRETDKVTSTDPYVQGEWQGEKWSFLAGLRHSVVRFEVDDRYVAVGNGDDSGKVTYRRTTPVLATTYKVSPLLNFYASVARGFEAPTMNELFYSGANGSFSFDLKPASSRHLEAGVKAFIDEDTRADLALFEVRTEDELVVAASSGGRTSYRNAGRTLRRGVELAVDTAWAHGFTSRFAYTGLHAVYDQSFTSSSGGVVAAGRRLPGIAAHTLFGELAWRDAASGFNAGLEALVRSRIEVEDTNRQPAAPGFAVANLRVGVERKYGPWMLKAFARVDNLFDRQYVGSVIVGDGNGRYYESAPGRNWLIGAGVRYVF